MRPSRRGVLLGAASAALIAGLPRGSGAASLAPAPVALFADRRVIEVRGRAATVAGLRQPNGTHGIRLQSGDRFEVALVNKLQEPTLIHWHGLRPPAAQDGVPGISQPLLEPGNSSFYDFALRESGTYWMHSHHGLQEQGLLAAPLIIGEAENADEQEIVLMLHDFSFRPAEEILDSLGSWTAMLKGLFGATGHGHSMAGQHLNDVEFDAYLANDRTLDDPEIVPVERAGRVRLRVINGASSTNFSVDLGALDGTLIAVDGRPVHPVRGSRFGIAMSQRLDLRIDIPAAGAFPVLAIREGDRQATGIVLRTPGATVRRLSEILAEPAPALTFAEEERLRARDGLATRPADRRIVMPLTGGMHGYRWSLTESPEEEMPSFNVAAGERVEVAFENRTRMSHPMHLHGHVFQVVGIDGRRFPGAMRDTVLVPHQRTVTIALDADNPGEWMLHCHNLYHMAGGMMAMLRYS